VFVEFVNFESMKICSKKYGLRTVKNILWFIFSVTGRWITMKDRRPDQNAHKAKKRVLWRSSLLKKITTVS